MKPVLLVAFLTALIISGPILAQQRVVADCTVTYGISTDESSDVSESLKSSTKTVYIRGNDSRTDLISPSFTQSLIYNKTNGNAVILREFGNNKFMTKLDNSRWVSENKKYDGMTVSLGAETKTILGYECKKATLQMKDGSSLTLYYATGIMPSVKEFEYQFKDIPGFVLEYESQEGEGGKKIKYTATKINLSPVTASRFDIPTTGYRLLN
jgi:GLPGLI family protein